MIELIKNCKSIAEFGGPSPLFEDIYKLFPNIDGFNLFENNYWQKEFKETYKGSGKQYNCDVVNINIVGKKYDLILNSHVIEHIANPLNALRNWQEILNPGGLILSIIPDKSQMFDCKRPLTNLNHLIKDMFDGTEEDDETHIKEAVDLFENNGGYDYENYVKSSKDNFKYRAIHHHCFDINLVRSIFSFLGFEVIYLNQVGMHIYTIAKCV
jgi:2-polyprenyl-3-methyl-5-hydroxy-6-metoxy-1,4-benzoquinol methylase